MFQHYDQQRSFQIQFIHLEPPFLTKIDGFNPFRVQNEGPHAATGPGIGGNEWEYF